MHSFRIGLLALAVLLVTACGTSARAPRATSTQRSVDTDVAYRAIEPRGIDRHALTAQEDFQLGTPQPDDRVLPEYPARFVAQGPAHVAICSQVFVGEDGAVFGTAPHRDADECPVLAVEIDAAFRAASEHALRQWHFEPSYRCPLPQGAARTRRCDDPSQRDAVPVTRAYRFVFLRTERGVSVTGDER